MLLNNKDNVIKGNLKGTSYLEKRNSSFPKAENSNDMDNYIDIEPKIRDSTSLRKPGEIDKPREFATELREILSCTNQSWKKELKPSQYGEQWTVKILLVKRKMLFVSRHLVPPSCMRFCMHLRWVYVVTLYYTAREEQNLCIKLWFLQQNIIEKANYQFHSSHRLNGFLCFAFSFFCFCKK